jgi:hypothetical protein
LLFASHPSGIAEYIAGCPAGQLVSLQLINELQRGISFGRDLNFYFIHR